MSHCTKLVTLKLKLLLSQESISAPLAGLSHGTQPVTETRSTVLPNTLICSLLLAESHCIQLVTLHLELLTTPTSFSVSLLQAMSLCDKIVSLKPELFLSQKILICSHLLAVSHNTQLVTLHPKPLTSSTPSTVHFCWSLFTLAGHCSLWLVTLVTLHLEPLTPPTPSPVYNW